MLQNQTATALFATLTRARVVKVTSRIPDEGFTASFGANNSLRWLSSCQASRLPRKSLQIVIGGVDQERSSGYQPEGTGGQLPKQA